jgi:hypothetical protein
VIPKGLTDEITRWMKLKKHGHIQINFNGGVIKSMNRYDSVKLDEVDNGDTVTFSTVQQ